MAEDVPPPMRLMNFVSQDQLDESKRSRGERVEDGTAQRDRPLYEILKENKDKKDAEFNERFKHRPPKALDEDETDFLHTLDSSRKVYEQQLADEEAHQLRSFQAAVAAQSMIVPEEAEVKETPTASNIQEKRMVGKKNQLQSLGMIIKVKQQAKKTKLDSSPEPQTRADRKCSAQLQHSSRVIRPSTDEGNPQELLKNSGSNGDSIHSMANTGLVSYSDESDDD